MMIFLIFCSSIIGCSNDISEMGMSSAGPKDNEISSDVIKNSNFFFIIPPHIKLLILKYVIKLI